MSAKLHWTTAAEKSFISLKQSLTHAADLAIPDYKESFFLDVSEKSHTVNGVLFQKTGMSAGTDVCVTLGPTEDRHLPCTRHAAGVVKILQKIAHIAMGYPLTVLTTHSIVAFVNATAFTMTLITKTDQIRKNENKCTTHNIYT